MADIKAKLSDLIISGLLKRGILWEAKTIDTEFEIPVMVETKEGWPTDKTITVKVKCENMTIRIDKED